MASDILASSADTLTTVPEFTSTIPALQRRRQRLERALNTLRVRLSVVLEEEQDAIRTDKKMRTVERAAQPEDLEDLTADFLYADDHSFEPTETDTDRNQAMLSREYQRMQTLAVVRQQMKTLESLTQLMSSGPERIQIMQARVDAIRASVLLRAQNLYTGELERTLHEIEETQAKIAAEPEQRLEATQQLTLAQEQLSTLPATVEYDRTLHDIQAGTILSRTNQAILVSFEPSYGRADMSTVVLQLPSAPGAADFTQTLTLSLDRYDLDAFGQLLGSDIPIRSNYEKTIGESFQYSTEFINELVPFPLEVVEVDGQERIRIPQVVWDRFSGNVL